ncbi:hypothetical protein F3Y22_tig00008957pilonHSYRG00006 [Hibiscus syriacus]|uniref:SCP domain-containing protein n=1 Tax=Hibiscus syriacus TaxID=106335 RepID=A0A6A3C970_HIBSY|nr:pathogenesis-related leaf protein 4-like [Hibiscus syriacus]KAE8725294.1 hypothetical protein F3Y22_tig00008957pilonHSYRG00006 [Hibiscus syriacus]
MTKIDLAIVLISMFIILSLHSIVGNAAEAAKSGEEPKSKHPKEETPEDILKAHNEFRAQVGVPPLVWNETLAKYAQVYAKKRVNDCKMEHSMGPYGENLAGGYEDSTIADSVRFWATEKPDYDPASGKCKSGGFDCGHYTQIVARKTTNVGCAREKCTNGWYYVICSYYPAGNIEGEKAY